MLPPSPGAGAHIERKAAETLTQRKNQGGFCALR
jgi:hypothetical protein